jgi:hypothetical protein
MTSAICTHTCLSPGKRSDFWLQVATVLDYQIFAYTVMQVQKALKSSAFQTMQNFLVKGHDGGKG